MFWENCGGKDGKTSTYNFISGMYKAVPPLQEMFDMAGMQLPEYLKGQDIEVESSTESAASKELKTRGPNYTTKKNISFCLSYFIANHNKLCDFYTLLKMSNFIKHQTV